MKKGSGNTLWISLTLIAVNVFVYAPVWGYDFVSWDDPLYVSQNSEVSHGLTWHGVLWAFTTGHAANWHPLTWLSHMLDVQFYGVAAGPHHLTNLVLHIGNTLLLFAVLRRMTGASGPSAFVAALFAVHPQHVESVAWVSERKDVLSTLFWALTLWAYAAYVHQPGLRRYLVVIALFALGLMAKPMLVTLPFVLLLLDIWPLRRVRLERGQHGVWLRLAREKLPLLALAIVISVVTVEVQSHGGTVAALEAYPLSIRAANAPVAYAAYIGRMVWPTHLAPFYPYPALRAWWIAGSILGLIAVSFLMIRAARHHPYLLVGWLWYLGMLAPVIGLIQVGDQSRADRYTYMPLAGIFIIAAWGVPDLLRECAVRLRASSNWRYRDFALATAAGVLVCVFAIAARGQVRYWENSFVLWEHAVDVTTGNYLAHTNLGFALAGRGRAAEAMEHFNEALRINPNFAEAHNALGVALVKQGRVKEAMPHYLAALRIKPSYAEPHSNLGMVLAGQGRTGEAIVEFLEALRIDPGSAEMHYNLGFALSDQGRIREAIDQYTEALRIDPALAEAHSKLGDALSLQDKFSEAVDQYNRALKIKPDFVEAHNNLAVALMNHGRDDEAMSHFGEALRINPGFADAHNNLGIALAHRGRDNEAIAHFTEAIRIRPGYKQAQDNLGIALANQKK